MSKKFGTNRINPIKYKIVGNEIRLTVGIFWALNKAFCAIKHNPNIKTLNLQNIKIELKHLIHICGFLSNNHTIAELNLNNTGLSDKGSAEMAKLLKKNDTISAIYLDYNEIGGEGGKAILTAAKEKKVVRLLSFQGNQITKEGFDQLCKLQEGSKVTSLYLAGNPVYKTTSLQDSYDQKVQVKKSKINKTISKNLYWAGNPDYEKEFQQILAMIALEEILKETKSSQTVTKKNPASYYLNESGYITQSDDEEISNDDCAIDEDYECAFSDITFIGEIGDFNF